MDCNSIRYPTVHYECPDKKKRDFSTNKGTIIIRSQILLTGDEVFYADHGKLIAKPYADIFNWNNTQIYVAVYEDSKFIKLESRKSRVKSNGDQLTLIFDT